jgi:hypothetical protein
MTLLAGWATLLVRGARGFRSRATLLLKRAAVLRRRATLIAAGCCGLPRLALNGAARALTTLPSGRPRAVLAGG